MASEGSKYMDFCVNAVHIATLSLASCNCPSLPCSELSLPGIVFAVLLLHLCPLSSVPCTHVLLAEPFGCTLSVLDASFSLWETKYALS